MEEDIDRDTYVVDASFMLAFLYPDEQNEDSKAIFEQYARNACRLICPTLLPYEIVNSLKSNIKRGRISQAQARELYSEFEAYQIDQYELNMEEVLEYACRYEISSYDASYLVLARTHGAKLLTYDSRLKKI